MEGPVLFQAADARRVEYREHRVRLDRVGQRDARIGGQCRGQPPGHRVRVRRAAQPQSAVQQRAELSRQEPHLGGQLELLLALEPQAGQQVLAHHQHRLGADRAVLGAAEAERIRLGGQLGQPAAQERGRVGQPRAVQEQPQVVGPAERPDLAQLGQRVAGAALGDLGQLHRPRLDPVLVAAPGQQRPDLGRRDLAVRRGRQQQLAAEDPLGRAALVGVQVRAGGADHRLVRAQQQAHPEHVGGAAVEHEHRLRRAGLRAQPPGDLGGPRITAVGDRVTGAGPGDRAQHGRMGARVVVAAEALARRRHPPEPSRAAAGASGRSRRGPAAPDPADPAASGRRARWVP